MYAAERFRRHVRPHGNTGQTWQRFGCSLPRLYQNNNSMAIPIIAKDNCQQWNGPGTMCSRGASWQNLCWLHRFITSYWIYIEVIGKHITPDCTVTEYVQSFRSIARAVTKRALLTDNGWHVIVRAHTRAKNEMDIPKKWPSGSYMYERFEGTRSNK
jgi:hypothetical protein